MRRVLLTLLLAGLVGSAHADMVFAGPEGGELIDVRMLLGVALAHAVRAEVAHVGHVSCPPNIACWVQLPDPQCGEDVPVVEPLP